MKNGILKSMGMDEVPHAVDYEIGFGFEVVFEPNAQTIERLKAEHAARIAAGDNEGYRIDLADSDLDCVTYGVHLARRKGGVMLAGGMVPQAKIRGPEISRVPKTELFARVDLAFSGAKV